MKERTTKGQRYRRGGKRGERGRRKREGGRKKAKCRQDRATVERGANRRWRRIVGLATATKKKHRNIFQRSDAEIEWSPPPIKKY